jgi:hypothetical protein
MTQSVPTYITCSEGLILNSNKFELLGSNGVAVSLKNFEVDLKGGYRRINGFAKFGGASATQPDGSNPILGIEAYADGIIVCVNDGVYYTEDGITWIQVNRDAPEPGLSEAALGAATELPRASQGRAEFVVAKGTLDHTDNPYGVLYIATGPNKLAHFHINGTGGSRTYTYKELTVPTSATLIANHDLHLCVVDSENYPNRIYYSAIREYDSFTGTGSGYVDLIGSIVGIRSFRDSLYVFCENSINRLVNINDPSNISVVPVTGSLGCVDGMTIQEIGGDLIFLAPDGLRTIAGTARIGDVELGTISRRVQRIIEGIVDGSANYIISSAVIGEKNQYRLFYSSPSGQGYGIIGTLALDQYGNTLFKWSEIRNLPVYCISTDVNNNGEHIVYHGGFTGYVYLHDTGNSFDGAAIEAEFTTPDVHFGDLGLRKGLHFMNLSLTNEGVVDMYIDVRFDFESSRAIQPAPFRVQISSAPAIYGIGTYGAAYYTTSESPLERLPLQGSGHSISYKFYSNNTNPPYTINGFHTELFPSGRK